MGRIEAFFAVLILALMLTMIVTGCSDNTCKPVICGPKPTLENIWPNDDQRFWEYDYTVRGWSGGLYDTLYETEGEVPPAPSFDYIEDLLENHPVGEDVNTSSGTYRMKFDGDSTSDYGVTAQALKDTVYLDGLAVSRDKAASARDVILGLAMPVDQTMSSLLLGSMRAEDTFPSYPLLIHGGFWEKNDAWIGTYCEIDTNLCWKFLEEDLEPGHEFTHQLVPGISDKAFLQCKVLSIGNVEIGGQLYPNALECVYIVDYGAYQFTSTGGASIGWGRTYDYGVVVYAPQAGPLYSYERSLVEAGNDASTGVGDKTLILEDTGTPATTYP